MKLSRLAAALMLTAAPMMARAALPRFPQPLGNEIVFVADGNVWAVPKTGGTALRLTSGPGQDMFPRASPDGKWIAYTHAAAAGTDVWVIPATGGQARRLTFRPAAEPGTGGRHAPDNMVLTWTPDSKSVLYLSKGDAWNSWIQSLYAVPVDGGLPVAMPIDTAVGLLSYGPDGHTIVYNRIFRNFRTWKRYNGGLAQQLFTYDFNTRQIAQLTNWSGTNTSPMWVGNKIYYLSDQDANRRANIWCLDLTTKQTREVTHFTDYDIDFPAYGDGGIAFQQGGKLWMLDLPNENLHAVDMLVPDDGTRTTPRIASAKDDVRDNDMAGQQDYALSPNGKRALFSARGDIFSVPAEHGPIRDLTNTSGADEDHPIWSNDGKTVYYTTDGAGEQQVAERPAEGGPEKQLTHFTSGYLYGPVLSPDGKQLAFSDSAHKLWLLSTDGGEPKQVTQDQLSEIHDQAFSPDSRWLAYSLSSRSRRRDLYLYEIATGKQTRLGNGGDADESPVWSPDGKYLYFLSSRHENTVISDAEFDFSELKSMGIYAIPLAADTASPVAPQSDEGAVSADDGSAAPAAPAGKKKKKKSDADAKAADQKGAMPPIKIDLDGIMDRAVMLPIQPANIAQLDARGKRIFYVTTPISLIEGDLPGEKAALRVFDFDKRKDAQIASGVTSFSLSLDGEKVLVKQDKDYVVLDTKPDADKDDDGKHTLDLSDMRIQIDPRAEWAEMFNNAWRLERDFFFSTVMNGVNWQAERDSYAKLVPLAGSREDLNYIIGQLLGEISNSHTYVGGGDDGDPTSDDAAHPGLLGVDFALDAASGRYRFAKIYPGDNTRAEYRSPLSEPGLNVKPGDYLLAVNGQELKAPTDPYSLFQLTSKDQTVDLAIASSPDGTARHIEVKPIQSELSVRETAWINHNRDVVNQLSGGRVGYIYMSDMEQLGLQQFVREFYSQQDKQALILDDRWNGGGFVAPLILERLRRVLVAMGTNRERAAVPEPQEIITGPKIALMNHWSASDGDIFPYLFKLYGIGKLLGTRTWGGVRGIRGEWRMLDGGYVTIPEDAMYGTDSVWSLENHGNDPDIELENEPADLLAGHDAQLEKATQLMVEAIGTKPAGLPPPPPLLPAYPPNGIVPPQP
jgi:tricorn protease